MQNEATSYPQTLRAARESGSKFYFTGNPCRYGNVAPRLTSAGLCWCDDCRKAHSARVNARQKSRPDETRERLGKWRLENADRARVNARDYKGRHLRAIRDRHFRKSYGITVDDYDFIFAAQEGKCALCLIDAERTSRKRLFVDHCHESGRVRGLLCDDCNKALGVIEKYRGKLELMLDYVDKSLAETPSLTEKKERE